jgi:hypothetical protein
LLNWIGERKRCECFLVIDMPKVPVLEGHSGKEKRFKIRPKFCRSASYKIHGSC